MAESASRLVITSAAQHKSLLLAYVMGLPGPALLILFLFKAATDWESVAASDPWTFLTASCAMNAFMLPILLWRNEVILDKVSGKLTYWWGFRFWKRGRQEYDLASFKAIGLNDELPSWATAGGKVTPLMVGGFVNSGRVRLYSVVLSNGEVTVPLREFYLYPIAHGFLVRVGHFLDLPVPRPARRKGWVSALWHGALLQLFTVVGFFGGALFGLIGGGWFFSQGPGVPVLNFFKAVIPFNGWGAPFLLSNVVIFALLGAHGAGRLMRVVPATCPPCGGKAYLEWDPPWAIGLGFRHYRCRDCGNTWYPPPSRQ